MILLTVPISLLIAPVRLLNPAPRASRILCGVALIATLLLSASGCGVKLLYNNADRLTRWWVSDYIDMTSRQREFLDANTAQILYWHRTTQLSRYKNRLLALANAVGQPVVEADLQNYVDAIERWGQSINERAVPVALQLLLSLSPQQLEEFEVALEKSNREYAKEARRAPSDQLAEDARDYANLIKRFTGRLSSEQRAFIDMQHNRLQPDAQVIFDYRQVWQQKMLMALTSQPPDVQLLRDLMLNFDDHYTADFSRMLDANEVVYRELTVGLLNSLTSKQRDRLSQKLREYAALCDELIGEAPDTAPSSPPTLFDLPVTQ